MLGLLHSGQFVFRNIHSFILAVLLVIRNSFFLFVIVEVLAS